METGNIIRIIGYA